MIYNASVEIEAENAEEAIEYVNNNMVDVAPNEIFQYGEKTVDFADPVTD